MINNAYDCINNVIKQMFNLMSYDGPTHIQIGFEDLLHRFIIHFYVGFSITVKSSHEEILTQS